MAATRRYDRRREFLRYEHGLVISGGGRGLSATAVREQEIFLNGRRVVSAAATVAGLLAEQGYQGLKVATAVNGAFVPERAREAAPVSAGDSVEVVSARQGG